MATRSAGTGILVTLVTFLIATVGLLVLAVWQYSAQQTSKKQLDALNERLASIASNADLESDEAKSLRKAASAAGQPLVPYMIQLNAAMNGQITGTQQPMFEEKELLGILKELQVTDGSTLNAELKLRRTNDTQTKIDELAKRIDDLKAAFAAAEERAAQDGKSGELLAQAQEKLSQLEQATTAYRDDSASVRKTMEEAKSNLDEHLSKVKNEAGAEIQSLKDSTSTLQTALGEAQKKLSQFEAPGENPALLVDGKVLESGGSDALVFLDIGNKQRVRPGMTFEVFDSAEQIASADQNHMRGKASIQIMKAGDDTSTARIIRSTPGQPVLRGNIIANAVYSPNHRYRFLVHGKFDLDTDNRSTQGETDALRNRIAQWGGVLSDQDRITGDLDFIVLGTPPRRPMALQPNAPEAEVAAFQETNAACDLYEKILAEATAAKIPVLNWNRFQSLTGMTD